MTVTWTPIDPSTVAAGVPIAAPQAPLPNSWIRCPFPLPPGGNLQLDLIVDCWNEPGYYLQDLNFDHRPPDYTIRLTGQFSCTMSPEGLVELIRSVLAGDPHHFVTDMDWTRSVVSVSLPNAIIQIHGTLANWTTDTTSPFGTSPASVGEYNAELARRPSIPVSPMPPAPDAFDPMQVARP